MAYPWRAQFGVMLHVLGCITGHHDLRLVAIAFLLCIFACWTSVSLLSRIHATQGRTRTFWIASTAFVFGAGVWATHFVGILAYQTAFPVSYDLGLTTLSIAVAIGLSAAGFSLTLRPRGAMAGGLLAGLGISAMHYVGMAALKGDFHLAWNMPYILASIVIGTAFGAAALQCRAQGQQWRWQILSAAILTLGICLMHFTAMSAVVLVPDPGMDYHGATIAPGALAVGVTAITILIVALGQISAQLDRHLAQLRSAEATRQNAYIAELEEAKRQMNRALYDACAANDAKSAFLANMSHELRTPLNAVIGFSELIRSEPFGPLGHVRYGEYIDDIRNSGAHLLSLINDILDLSRLDAGKADLNEKVFSLSQCLRDCCRSMEPQARHAGLDLVADIAPDLPLLNADERRIKQIVLNLLSNAIKFTPEKGRVTIQATMTECGPRLCVRDTGIGMSKEDLPKALEEFGQIDSSLSRKFEGSGLGLPLTRKLAELHDARFEIESQPGLGTTVTVMFPMARVVSPPANLLVLRAAG